MTLVAWLLALTGLAFALWLTAAFLLRLRHLGRLVLTIAVPALFAGGWVWLSYLEKRTPGSEPGWDAVFLLVSFFVGAFAALAVLPVWFVAEEKLGWRAR
ncbi:hypothetical protein LZK98_13690 [Sphingomonas cannabina]|uniref:hypothetical protein n=1 Tax=Sphingomonas cannabina TaxID=2899123 RepID=UPI001F37083A|nr:hypothetical protein [Sphingomonas cannabina]UIJ44125.1 hypothetical protein LZK98_13690 [Sphingomonas cannabina]